MLFLRNRPELLLSVLLLAVGLGTTVVQFHLDRYSFLYFGDAASHIVKARSILDSQHQGLENLGTVWLPLPPLLLLPAVMIDRLFYSGLAGAAVGIPLSVGTGLLLLLITRRLTRSAPIAFLAACLFCLNPNVVYLSLTPMSESALFFFVTLGGYALLRGLSDRSAGWLLASASSVMLATLCRYEAWLLPLYLTVLSFWYGKHAWKLTNSRVVKITTSVALISLAGILLWCGWNLVRYGDALTFVRWTYDAAPAAVHNASERLPMRTMNSLIRAILVVIGPPMVLTAAGMFLHSASSPVHKNRAPLLLYFTLPALFILGSIVENYVQIDQWRWNWRYVLTIGLFLTLASGSGLTEIFDRLRSISGRVVIGAALLAMPILQLTVPSIGVAVLDDAARCFSDDPRAGAAIGLRLGTLYHGGNIALYTGYGQAHRIMVSSGIPMRAFHILNNPAEGAPLGSFTNEERFLIIGKDRTPESASYVDNWIGHRDILLLAYAVISEDSHYLLLERSSNAAGISEPPGHTGPHP